MSQAWREFDSAIDALDRPGSRRERLRGACTLPLVNLRKKELPAECQADFERLTRILGVGRALPERARLDASLAGLSEARLEELIILITRIHDALARYQPLPRPGSAT